jgi:rhodanese-related sulfurtransferase
MRGYGSALIAMLSLGALGCQREAAAPTEQKRIEAQDIDRVLAESDALLLDVRDPEEIEELGTIEGYVNIPIEELESRLDELPRDKTILTA